tara:strand:- start:355 stop:585 length:231 start_codon:yes stop_codon:yes gene_type:complete
METDLVFRETKWCFDVWDEDGCLLGSIRKPKKNSNDWHCMTISHAFGHGKCYEKWDFAQRFQDLIEAKNYFIERYK